jgi:hypothetical protein
MDSEAENATFPRLWAYGASLRGPWGSGLFSLEAGHYVSDEDEKKLQETLQQSFNTI